MPCLDLKKLLPHRKVWKLLRKKLPFKLIKSKANKKPKNQYSYKKSKKFVLPSLSIKPKKFKKRHKLIHHTNCCYQRRAPVFVDHLFIEPVSTVTEHVVPADVKEKLPSSFERISNHGPESSKDAESSDDQNIVSADDAWEAVVLASPQMHEINERADEFIARFRAEMNHQEMLARRL